MKKYKLTRNKIEDSYTVVSKIFKCTPNYVRQIVADTKHIRHKGERTIAIRQAYLAYKNQKKEVIKRLEKQFSKVA